MMKSGQEHIAQLRDGRHVMIGGKRVEDVSRHPAFERTVATVGGLFDFARAAENHELMTFATPSGARANRIWQLPETYADLTARPPGDRGLERAARRFSRPGAGPCRLLHFRHVYGARRVRGPRSRPAPGRSPAITNTPATTTSTSPMSSSIRRPTDRRAPRSSRTNSWRPASSIRTWAASRCGAPRCSAPAASWPTRSLSRSSSRSSPATRSTPSPSPSR